MAALSIAQMNLVSTGPIVEVALTAVDCERWGVANFRSLVTDGATDCWDVTVRGERSHGGGAVYRYPDGRLFPDWP